MPTAPTSVCTSLGISTKTSSSAGSETKRTKVLGGEGAYGGVLGAPSPVSINTVSKRSDSPPVYNLKRGDQRLALSIAANANNMQTAMTHYERDWTSAGDTSAFNFATWADLHEAYR